MQNPKIWYTKKKILITKKIKKDVNCKHIEKHSIQVRNLLQTVTTKKLTKRGVNNNSAYIGDIRNGPEMIERYGEILEDRE